MAKMTATDCEWGSWRSALRSCACRDLDFVHLYGLIGNLVDSFTGVLITPSFNQYLMESCQLFANSLALVEQGYFDAAFYSVRQAGEVLMTGALFADLDDEEREKKYESWRRLEYFPSFSGLYKELKKKGQTFSALAEQMPGLEALFSSINSKANKYIHKQGFSSFYSLPRIKGSNRAKKIAQDFEEYFRRVLSVCAILRLTVDPFPILLEDPECEQRFPDSLTMPFSDGFISECLGDELVEQFMRTDYYRSWVDSIKSMFPRLCEPAYWAAAIEYVDLAQLNAILGDLGKLPFTAAAAVLLIAVSSPWSVAVHMYGGIYQFTCSNGSSAGLGFSEMAAVAEESGGANVPMSDLAAAFGPDGEGTMDARRPSSFITVCQMGTESVCVEADRRLEADVVGRLRDAAEELGEFFAHLSAGEKTMHDIERTNVYQSCREMVTGEGVS